MKNGGTPTRGAAVSSFLQKVLPNLPRDQSS